MITFNRLIKTKFEFREIEELMYIVDEVYFYKPRSVLAVEEQGQFLAFSSYDIFEHLKNAVKGEYNLRISDNPRSSNHFDEVTGIEVIDYDFDYLGALKEISMNEAMKIAFEEAFDLSNRLWDCGIPNILLFKGRGASVLVFVKYNVSETIRDQLYSQTLKVLIDEKLKRKSELKSKDFEKIFTRTRDTVRENVNYALQLLYTHLYATFLGKGVFETRIYIPECPNYLTLDTQAMRVKEFSRCVYTLHAETKLQVIPIVKGRVIEPHELPNVKKELMKQALSIEEIFGYVPTVDELHLKTNDVSIRLGLSEIKVVKEEWVKLTEYYELRPRKETKYAQLLGEIVENILQTPIVDQREQVINLILIPYFVCLDEKGVQLCRPGEPKHSYHEIEDCINYIWSKVEPWLRLCGISNTRQYFTKLKSKVKWFSSKPNACFDFEGTKSKLKQYANIRRLFKLKILEGNEDVGKSLIEHLAKRNEFFRQLLEKYGRKY